MADFEEKTGGVEKTSSHLGSSGGSSASLKDANSQNSSLPSNAIPNDESEAVVKVSDMPDALLQQAISLALKTLKSASEESGGKKEVNHIIARTVKKEFDSQYGPGWHCIVGRNFGSQVVHQSKTFCYFYLGQIAVLLFKAGLY